MLEACSEILYRDTSGLMPTWIERCLAFLPFIGCDNDSRVNDFAEVRRVSSVNILRENDYCFVKYIEILTEEYLSIDNINRSLNFVALRWENTVSKKSHWPGKEYGLVPVDRIWGQVHVLSIQKWCQKLSKISPRRKNLLKIYGLGEERQNEFSYLNGFYKAKGMEYSDEEECLYTCLQCQQDKCW